MAVIARLSFLGSVNAEQADALTPELHGVAIRGSQARFPCRWYLSLCGRMRAQPRSKVRSAPDKLSIATRLPDLLSHLLQY